MEENNQPNENVQPEEKKEQNVATNNGEGKVKNTVPTSENAQPKAVNYNNYSANQNQPKKKGHGALIAVILVIAIIAIAVIASLVYYFGFYTKADQMYKRLIGSTMDTYIAQLENLDYKTSKTSMELSANVDIDTLDNDISDLINKTTIGVEVQTDNNNNEVILNLDSSYNKKDLLNAQMYANIDDEETYVYLKDLLDKYIEVDVDSQTYTTLKELLNSQKEMASKKESLQKAMSIIKKELTNVVKSEYCSSAKEDVTINDKKVSTTKQILKLNAKQLKNETLTVLKNLKANDEFLKCFDNKDEISTMLEDAIEKCDELGDNDKSTIELAIYTNGILKQDVIKMSIAVYSESSDETVTMSFVKTADNTYDYEVLTGKDAQKVCTGTLQLEEQSKEEGTIKFKVNIEQLGSVELKIKYSQKLNESIDKVNVKNSVNANQLTTTDQTTLMTNLQNSELYALIQKFAGSNLNLMGNTNLSGNNTISNNVTPNPEIVDETNTNSTTEPSTPVTTPTSTNNEIISYDDNYKIGFNLPTGYTTDYISKNYVTIEKGDSSIALRTSYDTKDSYYTKLQKNTEYYLKDSKYKNVKVSSMESMTVNGRTFYYATFSYDYVSGSYKSTTSTKYIWSEISDKYVVDLQVRGAEKISTNDINEILTMTVTKNK